MNPQDNPQLTAYALGELDFGQARDVHAELQSNPSSAHELEQIEAVTDALRHGAPIPMARLTPEQRHAVLHPTHLPRRIQPMMPRKPVAKPQPVLWISVGRVMKAAAVIILTGGAFWAGWRTHPQATVALNDSAPGTAPTVTSETKVEAAPVVVETVKPAPVKPAPVVVEARVETPKAAPQAPVVAKAPEKAPEAAKASTVVTTEAAKPAAPAATPLQLGFSMSQGDAAAFASTTKTAAAQYVLQPALIRPVPAKVKDVQAFASPVKSSAKADTKATKPADLLIHSWQSEVAACPWNAAHRLLRVVIQLPASQAAVTSAADASFPMQISFEPGAVKQFRLLGERHVAAADATSAGQHIVWYEFQPNGAIESRETGRQIATVTVPKARFTSQPVGPFGGVESNKLRVIDRGYTLQNAREDFVFESAVVGFGLLMRGAEQIGSLNHELVLDLATRSKTATEAGTERARFVRLVQDARKMVGL